MITPYEMYIGIFAGLVSAVAVTLWLRKNSALDELRYSHVFYGVLASLVGSALWPVTLTLLAVALIAAIIWGIIRFLTKIVFWNKPDKPNPDNYYPH
jgi:uncharacterized membrane protein